MDLVNQRFNDGLYGTPEHFNDDIPLQLSTLLDKEMFAKLLKAKNFKNISALRDEISEIFVPILAYWEGPIARNTMHLLQDKIEIAANAGRDAVMGWYLNRVGPLLYAQASAEAA